MKETHQVSLAVDIFDPVKEVGLESLAEDDQLREEIFSPLGLEAIEVLKFDNEFQVELENASVRVAIIGDPYCDLWKSNALINAKFGQGGYLVFRISSSDQVALKRTVKQLVNRFKDYVLL